MPTKTVTTKFYTFNQNNSGGSFDHDGQGKWAENQARKNGG